MKRNSNMKAITLIVVMPYVSTVITLTLPMTGFQKSLNSRFSTTSSPIAVRSSEDCLYACTQSSNCNCVNYLHQTLSCEFCEENSVTTSAPGWIAFVQVPECSPLWTQHGESCYILVKEWSSWGDSEAACNALEVGSRLAYMKTQSTLDFLKTTYLHELGENKNMWIGGMRNGGGNFIWTDMTPMSMDIGWPFDQPDNNNGHENCVANMAMSFNLNDAACDNTHWSLCEYIRN